MTIDIGAVWNSALWPVAEKLLGIIVAGGFGGWVYSVVLLLDGGKQPEGWKVTRGCSVGLYMAGQAAVGVGGAFAALFAILTLGNAAHATTSSDLTENPIYFAALCVVGGFVGNRLLAGVGEKILKQLTDVKSEIAESKKESAKAIDTAREAESRAENAEAVANQAKEMTFTTMVARELVAKLDIARQTNQSVDGSLRTDAESALAKLERYSKDFPTAHTLHIVLANLAFALDRASDALTKLTDYLGNRAKKGVEKDESDASAWYNVGCYYSLLSTCDLKSSGYGGSEAPEILREKALQALKECLEISKKCGAEVLGPRLKKIATDTDLQPLAELEGFKSLIGRYSGDGF